MDPVNTVATHTASTDLWYIFIKSAGMLSLVVGILIAVLYLLKHFLNNSGIQEGTNSIKMLSSFHITPKERVVLLEVLGEKHLIGVTAQTISQIAKIEGEEVTTTEPANTKNKSFLHILKKKIDFKNSKTDINTDSNEHNQKSDNNRLL